MTSLDSSKASGTTIDAVCEEIRFQKAEALRWNKRAVEERERLQALRVAVHGHVQVIRGMCTDELDHREIDRALVRLDEQTNPEENS